MQRKTNLIDREYFTGELRKRRPELSEATVETYYGTLGRLVESALLLGDMQQLKALFEQAGFSSNTGGYQVVEFAAELAKERRN